VVLACFETRDKPVADAMMKIATKPKSCRSGWVDALKNDGSTVGEETEYAEKRPSHPRTVAVAVAAMRAVLAGSKLLEPRTTLLTIENI
jgi:hypothetical protein